MTILQAALLGIIQGVCEFLPISSSGHLVLVQTLFGISPDSMLFFDVMLHVGTLIAVAAVYSRVIADLIRHLFSRRVGMLAAATLPTVVIVLLLQDFFESSLGGRYLALGFFLTAALLLCTRRARGRKKIANMTLPDALTIGAAQGIAALLPGLSRSGATISAGLFNGLERKSAADFSFLLSIPAILGSVVFTVPDVIKNGLVGTDWACVIVGTAFAALSGFLAIRMTLRLVVQGKLKGFAVYLLILGALVLADQLFFQQFFPHLF